MHPRPSFALGAACAAVAVACGNGASAGGQTGGEMPVRCSPGVQVDPLNRATASPLGISGDDILAALGGTHTAALNWSDGTTSTLHANVAYDGRAGYSPTCKENEIDVTAMLKTVDGALDERFNVELFAATPDSGAFDLDVDMVALTGTFRTAHPTESAYDRLILSFHVDLAPAATSGRIDGAGTTAGQPERDFEIATF